ncbi:VanZ family protein [Luteimonas vadosa]|uniref:Membrane protein n=1 Tax=Luteimonas vadosa TaxID=1165507 RepID=A0ABP9DRU1_9GAMM
MRLRSALKPLRHRLLWSGLWSLAIAVVVVASLLPASELPAVAGGDKLHHFLAYFVLAAAAVQLYARWPSLLGAGLGLVLLGIGLEHAQGVLTETRLADRWDALANTLGVIAGLGTRLTPWRDALLHLDRRD